MSYSSNIVIHINESLDSQHRLNLSNQVQKITGVESASLQDARPHLMIVGFNRSETKACDVLNGVRKAGMHAQLVAWL